MGDHEVHVLAFDQISEEIMKAIAQLERLQYAIAGYTEGISSGDETKPTLADAEREAVESAVATFDASDYPDANRKSDTLRALLERLK